MRRATRRDVVRSLAGAAALALAACGGQPTPTRQPDLASAPGRIGAPTAAATHGVTPVLPNSDLAVGQNRFLVGLLDAGNRPIQDAQLKLRFFYLADQPPTVRAEVDPTFYGEGLEGRGVYVSRVEFPRPGEWGVEVVGRRPSGELPVSRVRFEVQPRSRAPGVGEPAVRSKNPTAHDVKDVAELCTASPPCDMHDTVIADAIGAGRPLVLYFGTPKFCTSRVCGPGLEVVRALKAKFGDRAAFVHEEIFKDPAAGTARDTVIEWRLPSEPWVFAIGRDGKVLDRFEGGITLPELEPAFARLLS